MKVLVEVLCACCGELGEHNGRRLCRPCYARNDREGTLDEFPRLRAALPRLGRLESFAELRDRGMPVSKAARQLGVTPRTGQRYEKTLKGDSRAPVSA